MRRNVLPAESADGGFTLIELVVAAALSVLVGTVLAGVFMSTQKTEASVRGTTSATSSGQLVASILDRSIQNSSAVSVQAGVATGDVLLRARTVGSAATEAWGCSAWYFSAADGTIRQTSSTTAVAAPATTAAQRTWTLLASGASAVSSTPVFALASSAGGGQTLTYVFKVSAGSSPAVAFQGASSSSVITAGDPTCF